MKVFHRTNSNAATKIDRGGYADAEGGYLTSKRWRGVWVSDADLAEPRHDVLYAVEAPETVIEPYEWIEEGKPYREFLVPADVLNQYPRERIGEDDPLAMR